MDATGFKVRSSASKESLPRIPSVSTEQAGLKMHGLPFSTAFVARKMFLRTNQSNKR